MLLIDHRAIEIFLKPGRFNKLKNVHIIGCGGLGKEIISYILGEEVQRYRIAGCWGEDGFNNVKYQKFFSGNLDQFRKAYSKSDSVIIAIGNSAIRKNLVEKVFKDLNIAYETYIHPTCNISKFSEIGIGCLLAPQTIICADAILKDHIFLNTECVVGHDTIIQDYCTLFPKVEICGNCHVEEGCIFGIGSIVVPGIIMKKNSKLDAMSVLRENFSKAAMLVGNPAKAVRIYEDSS